jgi:hypothetical protein
VVGLWDNLPGHVRYHGGAVIDEEAIMKYGASPEWLLAVKHIKIGPRVIDKNDSDIRVESTKTAR